MEQNDYELRQRFQIGTKRFQIRAEVKNWGKRGYKSRQGLQIGASIKNRCGLTMTTKELTVSMKVVLTMKG